MLLLCTIAVKANVQQQLSASYGGSSARIPTAAAAEYGQRSSTRRSVLSLA